MLLSHCRTLSVVLTRINKISMKFLYGFGPNKAQKVTAEASPAASVDANTKPVCVPLPPTSLAMLPLSTGFAQVSSSCSQAGPKLVSATSANTPSVRVVPSPNDTANSKFLACTIATDCKCCAVLLNRIHKKEKVELAL